MRTKNLIEISPKSVTLQMINELAKRINSPSPSDRLRKPYSVDVLQTYISNPYCFSDDEARYAALALSYIINIFQDWT